MSIEDPVRSPRSDTKYGSTHLYQWAELGIREYGNTGLCLWLRIREYGNTVVQKASEYRIRNTPKYRPEAK